MYVKIRYTCVLAISVVLVIAVLVFYSSRDAGDFCFDDRTSPSLPDILDVDVDFGKSMFFIDTTCESRDKGRIVARKRAACAVESAALHNPDRKVFLLYASPGILGDDDKYLNALRSYGNVRLSRIFVPEFLRFTPAEDLYSRRVISSSPYSVSHYSDLLRFVTLFRFGGWYLDTDVLVLRPMEGFPPNTIGLESEDAAGSAVLHFDRDGFGHSLLEKMLVYLNENYSPGIWNANGPEVIKRFVKEACNVTSIRELASKRCGVLNVFPQEYFYAIPWTKWGMFFDESDSEAALDKTNGSYVIHVWNQMSAGKELKRDSEAAYARLAKRHCPKVFGQLSESDRF